MQLSGVESVPPKQVHLGSTSLQSGVHPIPSLILMSSHASGGRLILLPQISHSVKSAEQNEFASIWHEELQPSPLIAFLSSHCSLEETSPSPQVQWQTEGSA